jgi:ppGpp synthetase/RelA/SpoT-type nucleotidyltranferase
MNLRTLTDELRESMQETSEQSLLSSLTETLRVLMDDAAPVGTKHKWADGRTWVKQRDGSWKPDPTSGRKILALPAGAPVSAPKSKPGTGTTTAVVKAPSAAAAPGKATADNLPDDPFKYFHKTPDAKLIPVSALRTIRARPEGIRNAAVHMAKAFNGEGDKRKPVSLKDNGDGTYTVLDGNSTTAMARQHNWKNIVATVEPADKAPSAPEEEEELKDDTPDVEFADRLKDDHGRGFRDWVANGTTDPKTGERIMLAKGVTPEEHVRIAKDFIAKHRKTLPASLEKLEKVMTAAVPGAKVGGRVKKVSSTLLKLTRKPKKYKTADLLQDGTGMRVIVNNLRELETVVAALKKNYKFVMKPSPPEPPNTPETDDYVRSPAGGDKEWGYRSFHAIIEEDGLQKEVQLRTQNQHEHSEWCHDLYKPRSDRQREGNRKHKDELARFSRELSNYLADVDAGRKAQPPPCPEPVREYFTCP